MTGWIADLFSYFPTLRLVSGTVDNNPFILCVKPHTRMLPGDETAADTDRFMNYISHVVSWKETGQRG
jgi:hypothetical protein